MILTSRPAVKESRREMAYLKKETVGIALETGFLTGDLKYDWHN